jgi:hypothetical protein
MKTKKQALKEDMILAMRLIDKFGLPRDAFDELWQLHKKDIIKDLKK